MTIDSIYTEIFKKMSDISGIKFTFKKCKNKNTIGMVSYALNMKKSGYDEILFKKTELRLMYSDNDEIDLEKHAIVAIMANKLNSIYGINSKTGKIELVFEIPEFESSIELKMKLDLL